MGYLSATGTFLYYLFYPIFILLTWVWAAIVIVTAPALHLGHYILHACLWPWHIIMKFETLYIFFGVAVLIGTLAGTALSYLLAYLVTALDLESKPPVKGRTAASYRAERNLKAAQKSLLSMPKTAVLTGPSARKKETLREDYAQWVKQQERGGQATRGLLSTTILEEDDSSEAGF